MTPLDDSTKAAATGAPPPAADSDASPQVTPVVPIAPALPVFRLPNNTDGEWYFQEPTTRQPAGPWTLEQLRVRLIRNQIDGLTPIWRRGLSDWRPLAEVQELKECLQRTDNVEKAISTDDGPSAKRQKRIALDDVPLIHTHTSDQGVLYVYDTVDEDWKASEVYEAFLKTEEEEDKPSGDSMGTEDKGNTAATPDNLSAEAQEALSELFTDVGISVPALGNSLASVFVSASGVASEPVDPETEAKRQKRRDYRERKKLKQQAGLFVKAKENPNVYVSGLPRDVTLQELEPVFKRAGVLKVDVDTGGSKLRIYCTDSGDCKGDALVTYANAASVELAVKFLNEFELRPQCRICVQAADFEDDSKDPRLSKDELKKMAAKRNNKGELKKYRAAKTAQQEAVSWNTDMDDGTGRRVVVLRHMYTLEEAEKEGPEFYVDLEAEVKEECEKVGQVAKVTPLQGHKQGIVCVKFKSSSEAEECIRVMDGRYFAGRTVEASFHDGKTDLRLLGGSTSVGPKSQPPALAAKAAVRADVPAAAGLPAAAAAAAEVSADSSPAPAPVAAEATVQGPLPLAAPAVLDTNEALAPDQTAASLMGGKNWEAWLDDQSSDSDSDLRVRVEE